jgi:hypothetical protein
MKRYLEEVVTKVSPDTNLVAEESRYARRARHGSSVHTFCRSPGTFAVAYIDIGALR